MSSLFPSFLSLGQRLKRLLATDVKSIWQDICDQEVDLPVTTYVYW